MKKKKTLNWLIGGIQAQNGIAEGKWDEIKIELNKIDQ